MTELAAQESTAPIADSPLQIGSWAPFTVATPPWLFPMVYKRWGQHDNVETYANLIADEINSRPPDQPIWLQTPGWQGNRAAVSVGSFGPDGWDHTNVVLHGGDVTPEKTASIWPTAGVDRWRNNQQQFLNTLQTRGARLDVWALDHESSLSGSLPATAYNNFFRNIVMDPRWASEPLWGLGHSGADLLDPTRVKNLNNQTFIRHFYRGDGMSFQVVDSRIAFDYVTVVARFERLAALTETFLDPIHEAYPQAVVTDFGSGSRLFPLHYEQEFPLFPGMGSQEAWRRVRLLNPSLGNVAPGLGDAGSPVYYGCRNHGGCGGSEQVALMLEKTDELIALYGNPQKVVPWINALGHHDESDQYDRLTNDEYKALLVGLVQRGINRLLLWNPVIPGGYSWTYPWQARQQEMLAIYNEVHEAANRRPVVDANAEAVVGQWFNLNTTIHDDGLPINFSLVPRWRVVSVPPGQEPKFDLARTMIRFSHPGIYHLRVQVTDGAYDVEDNVVIQVLSGASARGASGDEEVAKVASGCSATGSNSGFAWLLCLALAWLRRRNPSRVS